MISIVIPLYNRANLIRYALESLSGANHPNISLEVIVIDDASADEGPDIIERDFPSVVLVRNGVNKGAPACRNQGLWLAKGEFVLFLDSDDIIEEAFFDNKIKHLQENDSIAGVYGPWDYFESRGIYLRQFVRPRHSDYPLLDRHANEAILCNLLSGWYIPINAMLWRRISLIEAGGFSAELSINQDVDLLFRMLLKFKIAGQNGPKALIRIHDGERIGDASSERKYIQIFELRKSFVERLESGSLWNINTKTALAQFCLKTWASIRIRYPKTAIQFLNLYKSIGVRISLTGGFFFMTMTFVFGSVNAIRVRHVYQTIRKQLSVEG